MRLQFIAAVCLAIPVVASAQDVCLTKPALCKQAEAIVEDLSVDLPIDLTIRGEIWQVTSEADQLTLRVRAYRLVGFLEVFASVNNFACETPQIKAFSDDGGVVNFDLPKVPPNLFFDPSRCEAD